MRLAWLAFALTVGPAAAAIDVTAAWRGWANAGVSELELRVPASARGGQVEISLQSAAQQIVSSAAARAGVPTVLRLPTPTAAPLRLAARNPDGVAHLGQFEFQQSERPIVIWANGLVWAGGAVEQAAADVNLLAMGAADLPRLPQSYSSISGIVIDDTMLKALDDLQMSALLQHIRACGFTIALNLNAAAAALQRSAGCGGRQLIILDGAVAPAEAVRLFMNRDSAAGPSANALGALAPADPRLNWLLVALLAYGVCAAATLLLLGRSRWLLALPPLATGALALALYLREPQQTIVVWAEGRSGDRQAQFTGRLRLQGTTPARAAIALPALIEHAEPCEAVASTRAHWDAVGQHTTHTDVDLRLLSTRNFCFAGSFPVSYAARAQQQDANTLQFSNSGAAGWVDARLLWQGRTYRAAALAPQGVLRIDLREGMSAETAAERLAAARLRWGQAGLLVPLQLTLLAANARQALGWLFVSIPVTQVPQ